MALNSTMVELGTAAPDFTLPAADGSGEVSLAQAADGKPLLVVFMCVHCPYVKHIETALGELTSEYAAKGINTVGISSNDIVQYPGDAPEHMVEQAERCGFEFPYLVDESQEVAQAYGAACTPDFFLYDADLKLAYRGQFDDSRHKNDIPVTGSDLRAALDAVAKGELPQPDQVPSQGCGIKWKPGNEPKPTFSLL